jgi:pSer/pThr/pTyr-binding forkhead associated (FHA) protein
VGSGLGHAPTLPQPPQLDGAPPTRAAGPVAPSSAFASLAAAAAPATYPQQPFMQASPVGFGGTQALSGRAAATSTPRLVVLRDDGSEGTAFPLAADIVDLGRRDGDILLHDDLYVSPRHARFRREGDRVRVIDLASTNGIYLRLRGQHRLTSGNLILLGLEVLQFQLVKDAAPPASPHAPSAAGPRGRGGAGAPAASGGVSGAPVQPVQPFGSDFDAIEATWAGKGNPWASGGSRNPAAGPAAPPVAPPVPGFGQASQHGTLVFGSPATSRKASLHQRTIEGIVRDVYHLVRDEVVLGREGADIVFSADPFMSRRHAVIRRDPATDVYTLVDLESSNGTFVRIENDAFLKHGDEIRIGRHLFRFDRDGGEPVGASAADASHA